MRIKAILLVPIVLLLAACGGGSGGGSIPNPGPTPTATPVGTPSPTPTPTGTPAPVGDSTAAAYTLTDNPNALVGDPATLGTFPKTGTATNTPVDGIACSNPPSVAQHFHAHVTVINNGTTVVVSSGIGMFKPVVASPLYYQNPGAGGCTYEIHVHSDEAVLHIESVSASEVFNVQEFFDIWGVKPTANGFGPFTGQTRVFVTDESTASAGTYTVNEVTGKDLTTVPLTKHVELTVEVGPTFVPVPNYIWSAGL